MVAEVPATKTVNSAQAQGAAAASIPSQEDVTLTSATVKYRVPVRGR